MQFNVQQVKGYPRISKARKFLIADSKYDTSGINSKKFQVGCFGARYQDGDALRVDNMGCVSRMYKEMFWVILAFPNFSAPEKYGALFSKSKHKKCISLFSCYFLPGQIALYLSATSMKLNIGYRLPMIFSIKYRNTIDQLPVPLSKNGTIYYTDNYDRMRGARVL